MCPEHRCCGHGGPGAGPSARALASRRCAVWGLREGVPGGMPCAVVRGVRGQALVPPRLPGLRAGCRGLLPTCCGRGRAGVGAQHCSFGLHALRRAACRGGWWEAVPGGGGGWPSTVVRGVWCQALSLSRLPVPAGRRPGPVARLSQARVVCEAALWPRFHTGQRAGTLPAGGADPAGALPRGPLGSSPGRSPPPRLPRGGPRRRLGVPAP